MGESDNILFVITILNIYRAFIHLKYYYLFVVSVRVYMWDISCKQSRQKFFDRPNKNAFQTKFHIKINCVRTYYTSKNSNKLFLDFSR